MKTLIAIVIIIVLSIFMMCKKKDYVHPVVIPDLLSQEECLMIMKKAKSKLKNSTLMGPNKNNQQVRKSETAWLSKRNDPEINKIVRRICQKFNRNFDNCDDLQVVKYEPNGFYKPHQDACCDQGCRSTGQGKNQRQLTILMALNEDYDEGHTVFPNLKKKFRLQTGSGLKFHTLDKKGRCTPLAVHGGSPVKNGEKWICTVWIHERFMK